MYDNRLLQMSTDDLKEVALKSIEGKVTCAQLAAVQSENDLRRAEIEADKDKEALEARKLEMEHERKIQELKLRVAQEERMTAEAKIRAGATQGVPLAGPNRPRGGLTNENNASYGADDNPRATKRPRETSGDMPPPQMPVGSLGNRFNVMQSGGPIANRATGSGPRQMANTMAPRQQAGGSNGRVVVGGAGTRQGMTPARVQGRPT
ncbi:hypothetical protein BKA70DRAFT_1397474 [Coprinopsis sp. MPI-PUGE-AT-0042]|nr:hypothetical protein BKA70DRAFT_1397474 [Coprinopsis sp. MPI-PUGE-AT-0042]